MLFEACTWAVPRCGTVVERGPAEGCREVTTDNCPSVSPLRAGPLVRPPPPADAVVQAAPCRARAPLPEEATVSTLNGIKRGAETRTTMAGPVVLIRLDDGRARWGTATVGSSCAGWRRYGACCRTCPLSSNTVRAGRRVLSAIDSAPGDVDACRDVRTVRAGRGEREGFARRLAFGTGCATARPSRGTGSCGSWSGCRCRASRPVRRGRGGPTARRATRRWSCRPPGERTGKEPPGPRRRPSSRARLSPPGRPAGRARAAGPA